MSASIPSSPADGVLATGQVVVQVDYHQFLLLDGVLDATTSGRADNGLAEVLPATVVIHTGISIGPVRLVAEVRSAAPTEVLAEDWDEVVEFSLDVPTGQLRVAALMDGVADPFPTLTPAGPGAYRIRVHARGRDLAYDLGVEEPVEDYLIQVWPAPLAPELAYKQTDQFGARMRLAT